jgi:hypothetical protein
LYDPFSLDVQEFSGVAGIEPFKSSAFGLFIGFAAFTFFPIQVFEATYP